MTLESNSKNNTLKANNSKTQIINPKSISKDLAHTKMSVNVSNYS